MRIRLFAWLLCSCLVLPLSLAEPGALVAFAPGYPGSAKQAQPTMDKFATLLASKLGWEPMSAVYDPKVESGLRRLEQAETRLAILPVPAYLEFRERLELQPLAAVVYQTGAEDRWSLVAAKGKVSGPDSLDGWTLAAAHGYSPTFVRGVALAHWGKLPASTVIEPTSRVLSQLRKIAKGESLAVLVDGEQAAGLERLPFAGDLEVVTASEALPSFVLCSVGGRLGEEQAARLRLLVLELHRAGDADEVLAEMRIERFEAVDQSRLEQLEARFRDARAEY